MTAIKLFSFLKLLWTKEGEYNKCFGCNHSIRLSYTSEPSTAIIDVFKDIDVDMFDKCNV